MKIPAAGARASGFWKRARMNSKKNRLIIFAAFATVLSLLYLWQRNEVVRLGYDMATLQKEHDSLLDDNRELKMQTASLQSLKRVEAIAREKLHFVPAELFVTLEVKDETE
jgi:cell division protein FtsL